MRAPPAQAPPRFSRTGTRGQEPVAGAFAGDRYPGRVPKGAACEVTLLRAARAASPRTSFMISISSHPRASAAALALPLSRADAHLAACTQRRQRRRRRQRRLMTRVVTCMRAHVTARGACDVTARVIHCFDLLSPSHARGVARSLARARGGGGGGVGGGVQLHRASRASHVSYTRACTSPPRIARVITVPLPPRAHTRALRRRRRSLAR